MRRFSPPLLLALLLVIGLLAFSVFVVVFRPPAPPADADDDDTGGAPAANSVQGRRFQGTFGSLGSLIPQSGSPVVVSNTPVAPAASGAATPEAVPQAVATEPAAGHGDTFRDIKWIRAQGNAYTLQVLGTHDEAAAQQFIATQKDRDQFRYIEVTEAGQPWFVVIYGSFDTRDQAVAAADGIDGLSSKPFARPFSAYVAGPTPVAPAADPASGQAPPTN